MHLWTCPPLPPVQYHQTDPIQMSHKRAFWIKSGVAWALRGGEKKPVFNRCPSNCINNRLSQTHVGSL